ncbi:hypothetical protein DM867_09940 [Halosegnis rubeus]|uniref:Type IV pilin n=1 Tax=Halosegnis rubeus TaxID=2212850 RepID=A0A5N5UG92_9EURY|nr:hypothetical protein [Halosegnis rubeus]KAB7513296.1 hypothetical protein DM867_09940 [Halosegnis rubeus]KAB7517279.1 hypothetical protein DP108_09685 [Halosegnis rubeus]
MNSRAQSSTIGPILLMGVFVTVGVVAGGAVVTNVVDQGLDAEANVNAEIEGGELTLTHMGGDSVQADELQLLVRANTTTEIQLTSGTLNGVELPEQTDETFSAGNVWRGDLATLTEFPPEQLESSISVRLITDSGDVLASISTIEEVVPTLTPDTYVPGETSTATPTPESTSTEEEEEEEEEEEYIFDY